MDTSIKEKTIPSGWGAEEILRSLREDERRYRAAQNGRPVAAMSNGHGECKETDQEIRGGNGHE